MHIVRNEYLSQCLSQKTVYNVSVCLFRCTRRVYTTKAKFTNNSHVRHAKQQQWGSIATQILFTNNFLAAKSLCIASVHTE